MKFSFRRKVFLYTLLCVSCVLFSSFQVYAQEELTSEAFIETEAAQLFKKGRFEEAVGAFEVLREKYPNSPLPYRYGALAYQKLERNEEALSYLQQALRLAPGNVAIYFNLGETYVDLSRFEEAEAAFAFVIANDPGGRYQEASQPYMELLKTPVTFSQEPRRWTFEGTAGYEFHGNATFNPSDPRLRSSDDQNAGLYKLGVFGTYDLHKTQKWLFRGEYSYDQSLYGDSLNEINTFSNAASVSATHVGKLFGRSLITIFRGTLNHVKLDKKYFNVTSSFSTTSVYALHEKIQSVLIYNLGFSEFKNDTTTPKISSRDGSTNSVIFLNTFFLDDEQKTYLTLSYDYQHDKTEGSNFIRDVHGGDLSFHAPLQLWGLEGEMGVRYSNDQRPRYVPDSLDGSRRDDAWRLSWKIEKRLTEQMTVEVYIIYERVYSRNSSFEYTRPYGGFIIRKQF